MMKFPASRGRSADYPGAVGVAERPAKAAFSRAIQSRNGTRLCRKHTGGGCPP